MNAPIPSPVDILGVPIHPVTYEGLLDFVADFVASGSPHQICTANPEFVMLAQRHPQFMAVLQGADLVLADGAGLLWAAKRQGQELPERVTGSDGIYRLAERAAQVEWRIYLLGAAPGIAERTADTLQQRYPGLNIVGTFAGSPSEADYPDIAARIKTAAPDILLVAYGAPKQDLWIAQHMQDLQAPVSIGIGGAFDHVVGIRRRAPDWLIRLNLEWLWRLVTQPWRWRRQLDLPKFVWRVRYQQSTANSQRLTEHATARPHDQMTAINPNSTAHLANRRILVVGDLLLDEYLVGRVDRLSREAPVPVLEQTKTHYLPGGAANPAANIRSLGSEAIVVGLLGKDDTAKLLRAKLDALGIDMSGIVVDAERPTTRKTRIVAEGSYVFAHHLARVDHVIREPVQGDRERHLCDRIASLMPGCDAVLVSDYRSGVVTPAVVATIQAASRKHGVLSVVDSQGDLGQFAGFDLVRCNRQEAERYLETPLNSNDDFEQALERLVAELQVSGMVISRGSDGLSLLERGSVAQHLASTNRSQVFDVTGAGDTLIAVITLALAAGLDLRTAAMLGNLAAGIAVRRLGNVAVTMEELATETLRVSRDYEI